MINYDFILLLIFVFSCLTILRLVTQFVSALLQNPPKKLVFSSRELIFLGVVISYFITYILKK